MSRSLLLLALFALLSLQGSTALATTGCATVGAGRTGVAASEQFGAAVALVDANHDGYADLLVGSPGNDRASLFLATGAPAPAAPLAAAAAWSFTGQAGSSLGAGVSRVGDVNGDGFDDFAVGAPLHVNGDGTSGCVFLFLGSFSGPSSTPAFSLKGDQPGCAFGASLCDAGDLDGDGYADLVIGAPLENASAGRVFVFRGSSAGPSYWTSFDGQSGSSFGSSVTTFDMDGDLMLDIAVGSPNAGTGLVQVFHHDSANFPLFTPTTITGEGVGDRFGEAVRGLADVDGDGHGDLLVGAPNFGLVGRAYLYRIDAILGGVTTWTATGDQGGGKFGAHLAAADVTADGHADALVGAEFAGSGGRVSLFAWQSGPGGGTFAASPTRQFDGEQSGSRFGAALDGGRLVNLDAYQDFAVGAPLFGSTGKAYAYLADPNCSSLVSVPDAPIVNGPGLEIVGANPFRTTTRVALTLGREGPVRLRVLDTAGRVVQTLVHGVMQPGRNEVSWNGRTAGGAVAPAGVYFVEFQFPGGTRGIRVVKLS